MTALGALRLVVTVALSWALTVKLTPPNRPVDNGLEVIAPGAVILLLGLPTAVASVALIRQGMKAAKMAVQMDVLAMVLIASASLLCRNVWIMLAALPFAADSALLWTFARRPS
jgi:hypothetical protein